MDKKFRKVLSESELQDEPFVKEYLESSFKRRQAMKSPKLYTNLANIYYHHPKLIKNILKNINSLGYYKDIFYILAHDKNTQNDFVKESLEQYIYRIVRDQLVSDLQNIVEKKIISTMGKWLPRENSSIDKKTGFVAKFGQYYFPNIFNENEIKKAYRKLKTKLNIVIGTIECHMSSKEYNKIEFNKVSSNALKKNLNTIRKNATVDYEYKQHLIDKHRNMSMTDFVRSIFSKDNVGEDYMDEVFQKAWSSCRYNFVANNPKLYVSNKSVCFIDLNRTMYDHKSDLAIGIALVIDSLSKIKTESLGVIYVDNVNVVLDGNIRQKAQQIQTAMSGGMKEKNIETLCTMINKTFTGCSNMIIVSNDNIQQVENPAISYIQIVPQKNGYEIRKYNSTEIVSDEKNIPVEYNIKHITRTGIQWYPLIFLLLTLIGILLWSEYMESQKYYFI